MAQSLYQSPSRGCTLMADQDDVRRIALALPETREAEDHFSFSVASRGKQKGSVWAWNERVEPKKPRVPRADVVAIRVANESQKQARLACREEKFFTEPHHNALPATVVRPPLIDLQEPDELITDAWRCRPPPARCVAFLRIEVVALLDSVPLVEVQLAQELGNRIAG